MSSLGAFLDVMYKKRALEYEADYNQYKADIEGAKLLGEGIASIGQAVGSIGQGIGGYMDRRAQDQTNKALMGQAGITPVSGDRLGSLTYEMGQRMKMNQFSTANQTTPYQQATYDLAVERENRLRQDMLNRQSQAGSAGATPKYNDATNNAIAYQKNTAANMSNLYNAKTEQEFNNYRQLQIAYNEGALASGYTQPLQQVPQRFIPPNESNLYTAQQNPTTTPDQMRSAVQMAESTGYLNKPAPTYSTGIPPGSFAAQPGFRAPEGTVVEVDTPTYKGNAVWNGKFFVPR